MAIISDAASTGISLQVIVLLAVLLAWDVVLHVQHVLHVELSALDGVLCVLLITSRLALP